MGMAAIKFFCFWPGLTAAWQRGSARGLFVAVLFAWSLCLILLACFVWPDWFSDWFLSSLCWGAAGYWLVGLVRERFFFSAQAESLDASDMERFTRAQAEYLRGNWFEAEAHLLAIVGSNPSDIAAGLLLVGVLRRTDRQAAALKRLEQLCLYDAAVAWRFEIEREKQLISQAITYATEIVENPAAATESSDT